MSKHNDDCGAGAAAAAYALQVKNLTAQRDELLAACKALADLAADSTGEPIPRGEWIVRNLKIDDAVKRARAAISKAGG